MKTALALGSGLLVGMTLWTAPALADDPSVTVVQPTPMVVQQPSAPAAPAPVIVNTTTTTEGGRRPFYPGLTWGGVALWGVSYGAAAITAALADDVCKEATSMCIRGRGILYVPVAGPFVAIAGVEGTGSTTLKTLLALDGAFQLAGVAMTVTGIVLSASAAAEKPVAERKLVIAPYASQTSAGLGAMGHF